MKDILRSGNTVNMVSSFGIPEIDKELAECLFADKPGKESKLCYLVTINDGFFTDMYL